MLSEHEQVLLKTIQEGDTNITSVSMKTHIAEKEIQQLVITLGAKGYLEVELPAGKPKIKGITEQGKDALEDNTWLL